MTNLQHKAQLFIKITVLWCSTWPRTTSLRVYVFTQ